MSKSRLKRARIAEQRADELATTVDELRDELRVAKAPKPSAADSAPPGSRRDERGRFQAESWRMRLRFTQIDVLSSRLPKPSARLWARNTWRAHVISSSSVLSGSPATCKATRSASVAVGSPGSSLNHFEGPCC